ncbi:glycosyltransferase family 4 protein [Phototrophicus methaneseepsis]|uniref:Glycosyltransferase family 4 protein n=1 Tax=Phototrophicus methaneseepsis TaxID=2710758 RepID=A0A7S8E6E2_9CHLR|nr:glycosyltransferase family 1 protein [Phototrophicus methaneseepsis]QPC81190.1 glycosyltransferase family 4 protein [Phototrophicus methaneseepsis]
MTTITIDYTAAYEQGAGIGRLVREMTGALASLDTATHYKLFIAGANKHTPPPTPAPNFTLYPTRITPTWFARIWQRARIPLPVEAFTGPTDLYHATDFVLPPTLPKTRTIVTVHDLSFVKVPDAASPPLKAYLDTVVPRSLARADHIIADSAATKSDIIDIYGIPANQISVVLSGVSTAFRPVTDPAQQQHVRQKYAIGQQPFLLSVGTVQPRKNYSRIIHSLAELRAQGMDLCLVIAGGKGWLQDEMHQTIKHTHMEDAVKLIGYADDADLPTLYSSANCVVFPSLYEGFGFPVLEAMACGTPVITSNVSSLPEVAGDAALIVDPYDTEALTHAIKRVLTDSDLHAKLIEHGLIQAAKFTWEASAQRLREVYTHVLS